MALPFIGRRSVVFLAVAAAYICLVDRLAISIAIIPMVEAYDWSPTDQGAVMSAFFVGYVVLQLPAGWLSDRVGGKWVLGVGVLLWSLFTMLTPPAATAGIAILIICRFFMGVFESVTWPAVYTLFACWVPLSQRGFSLGLLNSAIAGGTVIAMLATPWLIEQWSWQVAFYVYGVLGLLWSAVWFPLIPNRTQPAATEVLPVRDTGAEDLQPAPLGSTMAEHEGVVGASLPPTVSAFTPRNVLTSSGVRALFFAHFCTNWVVYLSLAWSPTYLTQVWGVTLAEVGFLAVVPFLISVVATPIVGKWADHLIARGYDRLRIRKIMQTAALVGVAVAFVMIDFTRSVEQVILVLCFGNLLVSASIAGFGSNPIDLAPSYAGTLYGASNTLASAGSAGAVFVAGLVLDLTGSWAMVFDSAALLSVIGAAVFWRWASVQQEF